MISDEESGLKAGITGSDILWDSGMGKNAGDEIPIYTLNPSAARSNVYLGATTNFINDVREKKPRAGVGRSCWNTGCYKIYPYC